MFCWRGNVVWTIGTEPSLKDLSHVDSDEFILAIPDFTREPVNTDDFTDYENLFPSSRLVVQHRARNAVFQKVIMKLSGGVRWNAGVLFERRCLSGCTSCGGRTKCRTFDFIPHYKVHFKRPEFCCANGGVSVLFSLSNGRFTIAIRVSEAITYMVHCLSLAHAMPHQKTGITLFI